MALKVCPHLRSLKTPPMLWPEPDAVVKAIVGGPMTDRDFGLALNGRKVVGHLKFAWRRLPTFVRNLAIEGGKG